MADMKPKEEGLDCRVLPGDLPNTVRCTQSIPELGLRAIVNFDATMLPPFEMEMSDILDYLKHDVFNCRLPDRNRRRALRKALEG